MRLIPLYESGLKEPHTGTDWAGFPSRRSSSIFNNSTICFQRFDANKDGKLSRAEFQRLMESRKWFPLSWFNLVLYSCIQFLIGRNCLQLSIDLDCIQFINQTFSDSPSGIHFHIFPIQSSSSFLQPMEVLCDFSFLKETCMRLRNAGWLLCNCIL